MRSMVEGEPPRWTLRAFAASCWRGRLNGLLTLLAAAAGAEGGSSVQRELRPCAAFVRPAFAASLLLLFGCAALSGCNDVASDPPSADGQAQFVRRDDANMAAATVAIVSVDGAPADLSAHFNQTLDEAAAARRIAVASPAKARYLVRGYLTATPVEGGAEVDLVWDVFTPDKKRAQRLSDAIAVRGVGRGRLGDDRRGGARQCRRQIRRRPRRLSFQHPGGGAGGRGAELRPVGLRRPVTPAKAGSRDRPRSWKSSGPRRNSLPSLVIPGTRKIVGATLDPRFCGGDKLPVAEG